jgi:uncharacterized protein (TIGR03067 family)
VEGNTSSKGRDQEDSKTDALAQNHGAIQKPTTPQIPKTDLDRMQGVWKVVSDEGGNGAAFPKPTFFMVDGKRACWLVKGDDLQGGLYLDPSANPKTYDFASHQRTWEGIYSLDGDTLRLCYEMGTDSFGTGAKRPTSFGANERQILVVLKRIDRLEVFNFRRPDGSRVWPRNIEDKSDGPVQPPPMPVNDPKPAPKPVDQAANQARVGHIIIVGNEKTPDLKIRKLVDMSPGQVLQYPDLRIAEEKLAKLGPFCKAEID